MLISLQMAERKRFNVKESTQGKDVKLIDLYLGNRDETLFTGAEIIYATTTSKDRVVIKKPRNKGVARHEWRGILKTESSGISVPKPIALISYSENRLAIVTEFVEGESLYFKPNSDVKFEVGRQIKNMHQNTNIDGETWHSSGRSSFVYYDRYIFRWNTGDIEELKAGSRTSSILNKLTGEMDQFCTTTDPAFNHNDLHDGQVIVDRAGKPTIIDFGNWIEETWLNDVGYHLFHIIRTNRADFDDFDNFLNGYMGREWLTDIDKSNLAFYLLFISSRALTFFHDRHSPYLPTAQETHGKVLIHLEDENIWRNY